MGRGGENLETLVMSYKVQIDEEALLDIQLATDWYNEQLPGLGTRFQKQIKAQISGLSKNPNVYAIRYENVRCLVVKRFPFMVHFTLNSDDLVVKIIAVLHSSRNPAIWKLRSH